MAGFGFIVFALGAAMTFAPNTGADFAMGLLFAVGGLCAIALAYRNVAR